MNDKKLLGDLGENMASAILYSQGYEIIEKKFRCKIGEIDIIAANDDLLCFVEVKTRTSCILGSPGFSVNMKKQIKIKKVADYYMLKNRIPHCRISFMVFEILINQIDNAF